MNTEKSDHASTTGSTVSTFVSGTINQISSALPVGFKIQGNIDFDISLVNRELEQGKVDIKILGLGSNVSKEETQRIKFSIAYVDKKAEEAKDAENLARIAQAQAQEADAKAHQRLVESTGAPITILK